MNVITRDERKRAFHTLDGMRGVAAFVVVLHHLPFTSRWPIPSSYLAVDLFFALSGFVLAYNNDVRLQSGGWSTFMMRRLIRLYPLYLLGTLIGASFFVIDLGPSSLRLLMPTLVFIPQVAQTIAFGTFSGTLYPFAFPVWSLVYELLANAAYAATARHLSKWVLAIILVLAGGLLTFEAQKRGWLDLGAGWDTKAGGSIRVAFSFFLGVAVLKAWRAGLRLPRVSGWIVAILPLALFLVPGPHSITDPLGVMLVVPVFLMLGACTDPVGWSRRVMVVAGELSYPVYTLQASLMMLFAHIAPYAFWSAAGPHAPAIAAVYVLTLLVASWCAYAYYDRPSRRVILEWLRKHASDRRSDF